MTRPKAYGPQQGYRFQILCRNYPERTWEHCDYAKDKDERVHLVSEYRLAYRRGWEFTTLQFPRKYWN